MLLGSNIKYLRNKNALSQAALGKEVGVSQSTIGDYETGKTEPTVANIVLFSMLFRVSTDDLLTRDLRNTVSNSNHDTVNHTESDWVVMEQRIKDLELIIELQKKYIARLEGDAK